MTRMDIFIKNMILKRLHVSENALNEDQNSLLQQMIQDIYQDRKLLYLNIEQRVDVILQRYSLI